MFSATLVLGLIFLYVFFIIGKVAVPLKVCSAVGADMCGVLFLTKILDLMLADLLCKDGFRTTVEDCYKE